MGALVMTLVFLAGFSSSITAQKRNERDIKDAVRTVQSKLDDFEIDLHYQMLSTSSPNRNVDEAADLIRELHNQIRVFQENFDRKREDREDANRIIVSAYRIEEFLQANPQNRRVTDDWADVRRQIDRITPGYGAKANWNDVNASQTVADQTTTDMSTTVRVQTPGRSSQPGTRASQPVYQAPPQQTSAIGGTYSLDHAKSENVEEIVNETKVDGTQKDDLRSKLESPEELALEVRGSQVTLATTTSPAITFIADGRDKTEKDAAGRTIKTRATLNGDSLTVSSLGGDTDYTITFKSEGRSLKVSRRITTDYLSQTVFAESVYTKTDNVARLGIDYGNANQPNANQPAPGTTTAPSNPTRTTTSPSSPTSTDPNAGYSDNDNPTNVTNGGGNTSYPPAAPGRGGTYPNPPNRTGGRPTAITMKPGNYAVPNGVVLSGTLENEINTKASQSGDQFKMTITTPNEYRGAVIEGYLSGVRSSGRMTGQSAVTLNFIKITLPGGQTYDFAGSLREVRDTYGKVLNVDNESTVIGDNQTNQTAKRGGLGAGLGAVIGAIAGGAHGAVLGAVIGSGAGAGSVYAQGKDDFKLPRGSQITVTSTSPTNVTGPR